MEFTPNSMVTPSLRLLRPLGEGAMGTLWVAAHLELDTHVAVKFIAAKLGRDHDAVARFNREAASAAKIDNPHVVQILEHGTTADGTPYLAMELLDGESLGERLARLGTVSLQETKEVLKQVGEALDAAHQLGIVHRDIKPDNLFLTAREFGLIKVLDFGAAKQWQDENDALTRTGVVVGTPEYMSPEQVLGTRDVDYRSDLWALAAVAYRMLVGTVPFSAETPHALFFSICKGEFEPLAGTTAPLELEPWFRRAFTQAKDKRFQSASEMAQSFERALAEFSVPEWPRAELRSGLDWDDATELLQGDALRAQLAERAKARGEPVTTGGRQSAGSSPGYPEAPQDSAADARDLLGSTFDMDDAPTADGNLSSPGVAGEDPSQALERMLAEALGPTATPSVPEAVGSELLYGAASSPGLPSSPQSSPREWPMAAESEPSANRFDAVAGSGSAASAAAASPLLVRGEPASSRAGQVVLLVFVVVAILLVAAFGLWRMGVIGQRPGDEPTGATEVASSAGPVGAEPTATASAAPPEPATSTSPSEGGSDSAEAGVGAGVLGEDVGYLTVICKPACGQVWLGKRPLGRSPLRNHEVPVGSHSLSLMGPNLKQKMLTVEIAPGEHVVKRTLMEPTTPAPPATGATASPGGGASKAPPGGAGTGDPAPPKPKAPKVDEKVGF
jgi:serine/threonine protein kinase